MPSSIYLDHAATTALRVEAREAMQPFLEDSFGNPSSIYRIGREARTALDGARDTVAACLGARSGEVIFTGGGTESNNAAIKGVALASRDSRRHLVTTAIEHHAVLHPVEELCERFGFESTVVPVGSDGVVDPADVAEALRPDTSLVSVMWANNEIGTVQPVEEIADITRARGIPLHVDAVQAAVMMRIDLQSVPIDLLSITAHKFNGPKGTGVLFVRSGTPWWPLLTGGGQERNRRAGTENVAGIVGLARALGLACEEREETNRHLRLLRDFLLTELPRRIPGTRINGDPIRRLPNNANLRFEDVHGESLLVALDMAGIMASSGSACTSGSLEPSHVLQAIGSPNDEASLRLTVGRENTMTEMERVVDVLEMLIERQRGLKPAVLRAV